MNTLVVYDSRFGNTKIIAEAIANAIPSNVRVLHANEVMASELDNYDLLIVGAPTHGGRPSEPAGEMLSKIQKSALLGVRVAAFDTRIPSNWVKIFGFAAPRIAKKLSERGGTLVVEPEGFFVVDGEGPLAEGEVERAAAWAQEIVARVVEPVAA
jgi:flavodoxin